jgi:hypothetical protein
MGLAADKEQANSAIAKTVKHINFKPLLIIVFLRAVNG